MSLRTLVLVALSTLWTIGLAANAAGIGYISSASGYVLDNSGGRAVTATWIGQRPLTGFSGYGQVRLNGRCLSTNGPAGQQLRWDTCRSGEKAQIWALSNSRQLNNELGWCADVEGNRQGAGVRVLAFQCTRAVNQQFRAHSIVSAQGASSSIPDPRVRQTFLQTAQTAQPGQLISLETGRLIGLDGATLISAGGQNMIAAGGGKLISAGGMN